METGYSFEISPPFKDMAKSRISESEERRNNFKLNLRTFNNNNKNTIGDTNGLSTRHRAQHEVGQNGGLFSSKANLRHQERKEFPISRDQRKIQNVPRIEWKVKVNKCFESTEILHSSSPGQMLMTSRYVTTLNNNQCKSKHVTSLPDASEARARLYGIETFLSTFHMFIYPAHIPRATLLQTSAVCSTKLPDCPSKMVIAIEKATETVAIVTRPSYQEKSVYSYLEYSDHRRHKEQVNFRPVLHPIRFSDTAFVYLNNTRKRFLSRTFYEPRVRPQSFSDTTFNHPKTVEHHYVSYLDCHVDENRKWFKTCIEVKAKNFTSAQILRSQNNNYINMSANTTLSTNMSGPLSPNGLLAENGADPHRGTAQNGGSFKETHDPGASQVFIPKRRDYPFGDKSLVNGELTLNFPNSKVDLNYAMDDFSDV